MTDTPRIVFTGWWPDICSSIWHSGATATAERLGLKVELPKFDGRPGVEDWRAFLAGADVIFTTWGAPKLDETVLDAAHPPRFVGHAAGSAGQIVSDFLEEHGVVLASANKEMAAAVARWCFLMTQVALRNLMAYAQWGTGTPMRWDNRLLASDPRESVIGIWGYGDISRTLVRYLRVLEPKAILVCSRSLSAEDAAAAGVERVGMDELFERSDVVHTLQSLTDSSRGQVGRELLGKLRDGATLINGGRAHLIDEAALVDELGTGRINAIFDVHYEEPRRADSPFAAMPNVISTPHCANWEGKLPYAQLMLEEYDRFARGEPLQYSVDYSRARVMTVENKKKS